MHSEIQALLDEAKRHYDIALEHQRLGFQFEQRIQALRYELDTAPPPEPVPC